MVLRGSRDAGRAAAVRLATALGCRAVDIAPEPWRAAPVLAAACRYGAWLPVFVAELGPGDRFDLPPASLAQTPQILVTGQDGTVDAGPAVELDIPPLDRHERHAAWQAVLGPAASAALADHALLDGPAIHALAHRVGLQVMQYELLAYSVRSEDHSLARQQYESYTSVVADFCERAAQSAGERCAIGYDVLGRLVLAQVDGLILQYIAKPDTHRAHRDLEHALDMLVAYADPQPMAPRATRRKPKDGTAD